MGRTKGLLTLLMSVALVACGGNGGSFAPNDASTASDVIIRQDWDGRATVNIGGPSSTSTGLTLRITDRAATPTLGLTRDYPSATSVRPPDGAHLSALFTCANPGLLEIEIESCGPGLGKEPTTWGCLTLWVSRDGTFGGTLLHPDGVTACSISALEAVVSVPSQSQLYPPDGLGVAPGTFVARCLGAAPSTADLDLEGTFSVPVSPEFLLCQSDE